MSSLNLAKSSKSESATAQSQPISDSAGLRTALENKSDVNRVNLGTLLTDAGAVEDVDIQEAIAEQRTHSGSRLGNLLVASGKITEDSLYRALGQQMGIPYVKLSGFDFDPAALAILPQDMVRARRVLPLMLRGGHLVIATDDPADNNTMSALRFRAQMPLEAVLATPSDLDAAIAAHCPAFTDVELLAAADPPAKREPDAAAASIERLALEKPIVRLVNTLLLTAVQRRASDIHLHSREHCAEARYRIDGSLITVGKFDALLMPAIIARMKILAGLDITERRLPQDGAIRLETAHGAVDLRISVMPAVYGESVVIRILDRSVGLRRLADVGFDEHDERRMRALLDRNQGLVLVTGPTGSGKTTTLYAALQELNTGEFNIMTVEDPVEYRLDGLVQVPAQPKLHWGFAQALRHILRHDPDIILIGEIRDAETAKAAIESALTGHLVFSTLHTNSAAQSITRLMEIGIPSYLINATLAGVLAQRLARRNCSHCKKPDECSAEIRELFDLSASEQFWRGAGCEECSGTGYQGRIAVYELLQMSSAQRDLIRAEAPSDQIEAQAVKEGMIRLTMQALALARTGMISLAEVLRVRID